MFHKNSVLKSFCKIPTKEPVIEYFNSKVADHSFPRKEIPHRRIVPQNTSERLLSFQAY